MKLFNADETYTPHAQYISDTVAGFVTGCIDANPDLLIREIEIVCVEAIQDACNAALLVKQQNAAKEFLRKKYAEMENNKIDTQPSSSEEDKG